MKNRPILLAAFLAGAVAFGFTGCDAGHGQERNPPQQAFVQPPLASPLGLECRVQLRRDALGLGIQGIAVTADMPTVSVFGRLRSMDAEWVIVQDGALEYWIPRDTVLLIQVFR